MSALVVRTGDRAPALASLSATTRAIEGDAEIETRVLEKDEVVLGAFQRACEVKTDLPISRRASGGAAVRCGPGTVHVVVAVPAPEAPNKILNRLVRPLLKAVTKQSIVTSYFGRDWISAAHRPVGYVCFAHHSKTERTVFEAFVATKTPFALGPRASFQGKDPTEVAIDPAKLVEGIIAAYARAWMLDVERKPIDDAPVLPSLDEPEWLAKVDEAIGPVYADRTHLGGELMASSDAMERLHERLRTTSDDFDAIGEAIDAELKNEAVAMEGVRQLRSLQIAVAKARGIDIT